MLCDDLEGALGDLEGHRGLCDDLEGWDGEVGQEGGSRGGGDVCILMADSCRMAETNPIL